MNWNKDKSLKLSQAFVYIFAITMVTVWFVGPKVFEKMIAFRVHYLGGTLPYFLTSMYTLSVPAIITLRALHLLLKNIKKNDVFTYENVSYLRTISWCCIAVAVICVISSVYYIPFIAVGCAAVFVGLILRVVKNVMAQAVEIKHDNDFTI